MNENPFQTPQTTQLVSDHQTVKHQSFRLTVSKNDPNFKVGTVSQAVTFTLIQQLPVLCLSGLLLDGGKLFQVATISSVVFWCGFTMKALQSWFKFSDSDRLLVKWGYWPILLIIYNLKLLLSAAMR